MGLLGWMSWLSISFYSYQLEVTTGARVVEIEVFNAVSVREQPSQVPCAPGGGVQQQRTRRKHRGGHSSQLLRWYVPVGGGHSQCRGVTYGWKFGVKD